ncbi:DegT/DnrJ/EryC1/StrS aminotransferase family protein [Polynucleobacter sp. JS-JIR-II-b4]|uniref:DegT/DnrJ/EryC1/StrS family aminotransferase n=1 Tax=Polynucleobacter sp. JS-JIR-II-b4 TaxID=1758390 RepID=UPI001BFDC02D|nr:DegT/DnrJ/EryC1/StrS aminotransferase family protein [Polynucleobacter sp. JS-JIR-II-b4]QWE02843.1 DegT/DnrJ/EryC1/StrS aminotransferase family protein [Polynucleobacter sp. JS-JIR-II-b4]
MILIPVYKPSLFGNERKYVLDCLDSTWISSKGEYLRKFEDKFSEKINVNYATTTSNGTVALHLALLSLGIGEGDEVIVPTLTYIASVNAITYTGAKPIFVDSLSATWQMDPADVERKITNKTKAIMAVHLYGHPCEMDAIMRIANKHGLLVIEDAAEAFGSRYKNIPVGGIGHIATFSFFGNKTITTGEGGMVVTNDKTLIDRAIHFKGQGLAAHRQYWHDVIGYNYRMTNICAAIGLAQIEQADIFIKRKREIAARYIQGLKDLPIKVHEESPDVFHSYWMFSILVDPTKRDGLREFLLENGIETRPLFYPVHTMPMYSNSFQSHRVAEDLGWRGLNLPSYPSLEDDEILLICNCIRKFFLNSKSIDFKKR